jgi:hypothetical protein
MTCPAEMGTSGAVIVALRAIMVRCKHYCKGLRACQ